MRIRIDTSSAPADLLLLEPDDLGRFDVVLAGPEEALGVAIDRLGERAGSDHVYVDPARIVNLAGDRGRDPDWLASFEAMVRFAGEHGWLDGRGRVRAHLVRERD